MTVGELEDQLNSILSDPTQMEKIAGLAKSLMGGGDSGAAPEKPPASPLGELGLDPGLLAKLGRAMNSEGGSSRERALLAAMEPYLSEKRRGRMDRAMKLARLARIARFALGETGGGDDQPL